jgi:hypothetical protein
MCGRWPRAQAPIINAMHIRHDDAVQTRIDVLLLSIPTIVDEYPAARSC